MTYQNVFGRVLYVACSYADIVPAPHVISPRQRMSHEKNYILLFFVRECHLGITRTSQTTCLIGVVQRKGKTV